MPWKSPMLIYTSCYRFFFGGMFLGLDSNFCQPLRQEFLQEGRGIRRCGEDGPDPVARRRPDVSWWKHPLTSHSFWHFLTGTIYILHIWYLQLYIYTYIYSDILKAKGCRCDLLVVAPMLQLYSWYYVKHQPLGPLMVAFVRTNLTNLWL